jgi:flotillin
MGFRDDGDAARARAEALERENRELQEKIAALEGAQATAEPDSDGSGPSSNLLIGAGIAAIVIGGVVVGLRAPMLLPFVAILGLLLISAGIIKRLIVVVGPNEVVILSGRRHRLADGSVAGHRIVKGGRVVRLPLLERADRMSLETIFLELTLEGAYAKGGTRVDLKVASAVRIAPHEPTLNNAVERFLGRDREEIKTVARETVEGGLRSVVATLTVQELREDRILVAQQVVQEVEHDFQRLGLELDTFKVQEVREQADG